MLLIKKLIISFINSQDLNAKTLHELKLYIKDIEFYIIILYLATVHPQEKMRR